MAISKKKDLQICDGQFRKVDKYIFIRNGRVYAIKWHKGKNVKKAAPMQGALALNEKMEPTRELRAWIKVWREQLENEDYVAAIARKEYVPTINEVCRAYVEHAEIERQVSGRPREHTVETNVCTFKHITREMGLSLDDRIDAFTGKDVERWLYRVVSSKEIRATSAFSMVNHMGCIFARWARQCYDERGWHVPEYNFPKPRGKAVEVRYVRPDDCLRDRTLAWWRSLEESNPRAWVAVTMMVMFAMRNGDVLRLKWTNIKRIDGVWVLHYVPSKTAVSTGGRGVSWPMTDDLYDRLRRAAPEDEEFLVVDRWVWNWVNVHMRGLGWSGSKAAYELRKMCIDQVYRTKGLERAVQLSGDDTKTLMRYYADASRVSFNPIDDLYS